MLKRLIIPRRDLWKLVAIALSVPLVSVGKGTAPRFLVMAGGGAPSYNEIALEKNVRYFQRTLKSMGFDPKAASVYFANGNDGRDTVRYIDENRQEKFKKPEIPDLLGASTEENFRDWLDRVRSSPDKRPIFFYFTGHGYHNRRNEENNALIFWREQLFSVREFAGLLDTLPKGVPVVTVMAQCYAGSFANLIYEKGDPGGNIALQTRCGFFATVKSNPSVGCTPEVNEADYRDYSSSFFAGLSGIDRLGKRVPSADYDKNGRISYAEAHAFAKVDEKTTDLPISTLEAWLQEKTSDRVQRQILDRPLSRLLSVARPQRRYVVTELARQFSFDLDRSYFQNLVHLRTQQITPLQEAYLTRLGMELINIDREKQIRDSGEKTTLAILKKLIDCEDGSWK